MRPWRVECCRFFACVKSLTLAFFLGSASAQTAAPEAAISLPANPVAGYPLGVEIAMAVPVPGYSHENPLWPTSFGWTARSTDGKLQLRGKIVEVSHVGLHCFSPPVPVCPGDIAPSIRHTRSQFTIGPFPTGTYPIEVFNVGNTSNTPDARASLVVTDPTPSRTTTPWVDYSDHWWNPQESGWGMMIWHEVKLNQFMAAWFGYDAEGNPYWFTVQGGIWQRVVNGNSVGFRYSGKVYESSGPNYTVLNYDPDKVSARQIGTAVIEFIDARNGMLTFTIDGVVTRTTRITRFNP
jgi:hypothetical protein